MELLLFLSQVFVISLSGVLAPGPVTTAAVAMGARDRFAGAAMAVGHGVIELPLMVLIVLGADRILKSTPVRIAIGLTGGTVLAIMAIQIIGWGLPHQHGFGFLSGGLKPTLRSLSTKHDRQTTYGRRGPFTAGILLSGGNPYFLLWWATVGLALATRASSLGVWAFALFALVHWLCDLVWLSALSWASFKGAVLLGAGVQRLVLLVCALALLVFGAYFVYDAGHMLARSIVVNGR